MQKGKQKAVDRQYKKVIRVCPPPSDYLFAMSDLLFSDYLFALSVHRLLITFL
jgi:hypothetical protein